MSDSDGMDFILECVVSGAHGFLLLHPVVPGAYDRCYPRPEAGGAYSKWGAPGHA
jgi:hypothetical protein